jgi:hypothetical protein
LYHSIEYCSFYSLTKVSTFLLVRSLHTNERKIIFESGLYKVLLKSKRDFTIASLSNSLRLAFETLLHKPTSHLLLHSHEEPFDGFRHFVLIGTSERSPSIFPHFKALIRRKLIKSDSLLPRFSFKFPFERFNARSTEKSNYFRSNKEKKTIKSFIIFGSFRREFKRKFNSSQLSSCIVKVFILTTLKQHRKLQRKHCCQYDETHCCGIDSKLPRYKKLLDSNIFLATDASSFSNPTQKVNLL